MKTSHLNFRVMTGLLLAPVLSLHVKAQEDVQYPPPTPPLFAPVPDNAHWTIKIKRPDDQTKGNSTGPAPLGHPAAPAQRKMQSIDVTKTGDVKRDQRIYDNGDKFEIWYAQGLVLSPTSTGQLMIFAIQFGDLDIDPIRSPGYTGVNWIDLKNYDRVVTFQGRPAYHYVKSFSASSPFAAPRSAQTSPQPKATMEAWIDAKTGLPLGYTDTRGFVYSYTFLPPPSAPLELPPAYQTGLAAYLAGREK